MRIFLILLFSSFFLVSFSQKEEKRSKKKSKSTETENKLLKGMQLQPSGYYFRSIVKSKSNRPTQIGDVVFINQKIFTDDDSLIYDSNTMLAEGEYAALKIFEPTYKGDVFEILAGLREGDSVSFALRIDEMFDKYYKEPVPEFFQKNKFFVYFVRMDSVIDKEIVAKKEQEQLIMEQQMDALYQMIEDSTLAAYIKENEIKENRTESGLVYIEKIKGSGKNISIGDSVQVNYVGMLLDGTVFDSSIDRNETFEFEAGIGQVIPGWDEAILKMNEGSKATVILPSSLAYGPNGVDNVIPPYSTLMFQIEVLKVIKNKP